MQLNDLDSRILYLLESNADSSFRVLADLADSEEHIVRRAFHRLVKHGIITGRSLYVDTMGLGYTDYALYFSLKSSSLKEQQSLIRSFVNSPLVRWVADVGGGFDYAVTFLSQSTAEVRHFLDRVSQKHQDAFVGKQLALRTYMIRYPRRYLSPNSKGSSAFVMGGKETKLVADPLDKAILNHLSRGEFSKDNEVAHALRISPSTVTRRVAAMRESEILLGDTYRLNMGALGYSSYRVLVTMKRLGADLRQRVLTFCNHQVAVRILVESFGSWDYEMEIELRDNRDIKQFTTCLYEAFPHDVEKVQVIPVFEHLVYKGFPVLS
jgi:DNA-binding Lrp family transcriptional regulator